MMRAIIYEILMNQPSLYSKKHLIHTSRESVKFQLLKSMDLLRLLKLGDSESKPTVTPLSHNNPRTDDFYGIVFYQILIRIE